MARRVEKFEFAVDEVREVVGVMDRLGAAHDGWVNLRPSLPDEEEPPSPSPLAALFSTELHEVPVCTWLAGKLQRQRVQPDSLGVQHAAGPKTVAHLRSIGIEVPRGWRTVQDHPRRGLVVLAPSGTDHEDELHWLLEVATALSAVRLRREWIAEVHSPADRA
jgi:hypothetical protein